MPCINAPIKLLFWASAYLFHMAKHAKPFYISDTRMLKLYLENKGIVLKARWFVRPDINTGATII